MVGPVHPVPPHCPHFWAVPPPPPVETEVVGVVDVVVGVLVFDEVVGLDPPIEEDEEEPPPLPPPTRVPVYVLLIGPHLMLENVTEAPGEFFSTSVGLPEVAEHVPRVTPGALADLVDGYGASSQSMSAV